MNINRNNYEIYILDYYEGTLNKSKEQELLAFLELNPDIKAEFDSFENISLIEASSIKYDFKEGLKKTDLTSPIIINLTNYKEFFIADAEGDLSISQKKQLEVFLSQHPTLNNEYHIFHLAKLSPDKSVVFENKRQLKKFLIFNAPINKKLIYRTASIAASLLIMASVTTYYFNNNKTIKENTTNNKQNIFVESSIKLNKIIPNTTIIENLALNTNNTRLKKQHFSKKINRNTTRQTDNIQLLATISLQKINMNAPIPININEDARNYYTSLNNLLAFADEQINDNIAEQITDNKKTHRFEIDLNLLKEHPLAQAGGFLKNITVIGYSKTEELTAAAKNTYLAFEEKIGKQ